jgi:hypothetical protein
MTIVDHVQNQTKIKSRTLLVWQNRKIDIYPAQVKETSVEEPGRICLISGIAFDG